LLSFYVFIVETIAYRKMLIKMLICILLDIDGFCTLLQQIYRSKMEQQDWDYLKSFKRYSFLYVKTFKSVPFLTLQYGFRNFKEYLKTFEILSFRKVVSTKDGQGANNRESR